MYDRKGFGANFHDKIISASFCHLGFVSTVFSSGFSVFGAMYREYKEICMCSATHQDIYIEYVLAIQGESTPHSTLYYIYLILHPISILK